VLTSLSCPTVYFRSCANPMLLPPISRLQSRQGECQRIGGRVDKGGEWELREMGLGERVSEGGSRTGSTGNGGEMMVEVEVRSEERGIGV
jgi:hypothetical protein